MNFKQRKEDLFQRVILEKTAQLCKEQGAHSVTMREVAKQAGTTVSSIYTHFPSKVELMCRLSTKVVLCKAEWLKIQISKQDDALQKLVTYYRANFAYLKRHPYELSALQYTLSPEYAKADTSQMFQYQEEEEQETLFELILV